MTGSVKTAWVEIYRLRTNVEDQEDGSEIVAGDFLLVR